MHSSRPYLIRGLYEWLIDNKLTPHLVVDATYPDVEVPRQFVQNGQIVLNVAPHAVKGLFIENQATGFNATFGGAPMQVLIPTKALLAIYAKENGAGMVFGHEPELEPDTTDKYLTTEGLLGKKAVDDTPSPTSNHAEKRSDSRQAPLKSVFLTPEELGKGRTDDADSLASDKGKTSKKKPSLRIIK